MPVKNRIKQYGEGEYFHIYNRGVNKQLIFRDEQDYNYLLNLLRAYLSPGKSIANYGRVRKSYAEKIDLVAYCLMPNHYHLLVYLKEKDGAVKLIQGVMTTYSMYFNKKYGRVGGLFQGVFLASRINNEVYLWHISRYIHLNPLNLGDYRRYPYSSYRDFTGEKNSAWLHTERIILTPKDQQDYVEFVSDYETMQRDRKLLEPLLANKSE